MIWIAKHSDDVGSVTVETREEEQQFAFHGNQFEAIAGLDYHRARWCDPAVGQWLSEEPIGLVGDDSDRWRYVGQ